MDINCGDGARNKIESYLTDILMWSQAHDPRAKDYVTLNLRHMHGHNKWESDSVYLCIMSDEVFHLCTRFLIINDTFIISKLHEGSN